MDLGWQPEIRALFEEGGRLTPGTCPHLRDLLLSWMVEETTVDAQNLSDFVSCVIWNADRREVRTRTGSEWEQLIDRRSAREGVLGYLFIPRRDETLGLPRTETLEELVRGTASELRPNSQEQRQTWAVLREKIFREGESRALEYRHGTLREYGKRNMRSGRYADRLIADIELICGAPDELVAVLTDCFPIDQLADLWVARYSDRSLSSPIERFTPDYTPRGTSTSELDRDVETHLDASEFIADVTIPDGTVVPRGATVTKTWRIHNVGTVPWLGRRLKRMTPHSNTFPTTPDSVPVPDTQPGEEVDISVDLTTTHIEGATELRFKMIDATGRLCFPDRYVYGLVVVITTQGSRRLPTTLKDTASPPPTAGLNTSAAPHSLPQPAQLHRQKPA